MIRTLLLETAKDAVSVTALAGLIMFLAVIVVGGA